MGGGGAIRAVAKVAGIGGVLSFQEAKDATAELLDALDTYNFDQNLLLFAF
jgi:hypothetical protein